MNRNPVPWVSLARGEIWPLLPLGLIAGILLADANPIWAIMNWRGLIILTLIVLVTPFFYIWQLRNIFWVFAILIFGAARLGLEYSQNDTRLMGKRYYGPIEGRVVKIDQSYSGKLRVTLSDVELDGRPVYGKVRVSLHGKYHPEKVQPSAIMQTTGHLSAPNGPAEPGAYDFQKRAWLDGISAIGYTRMPAIFSPPQKPTISEWILSKRLAQAQHLRQVLGKVEGGFAAAIFVGDKSDLDPELVENMRASNLAHLLAISGMHMGTVCGLIFFVVRRLLEGGDHTQGSSQSRTFAVICALLVTTIYWLFSGMAYSATRAYLMAILFFGAIAIRRRSLSLENLSYVAILILIVDPSALFNIGFQMSFSATMALIVAFQMIPVHHLNLNSALRWTIVMLFTSLIAAMATAPYAVFHFNQMPKYGLLANFLAMPVMSFVVMPGMIAYALLSPIGLGDWPLMIVGLGLKWIGNIASFTAHLDGAVWHIGQARGVAFGLIIIAGFILTLMRRQGILLSFALIFAAIFFWKNPHRPDLLIASDARFFGLKGESSRILSRPTGHRFLAEIWTQRDGEAFDQSAQALKIDNNFTQFELKYGWKLVYSTTKKGAKLAPKYCAEKTIMVMAQAKDPKGDCLFYNQYDLAELGGVAINFEDGELTITPFIDQKPTPWTWRGRSYLNKSKENKSKEKARAKARASARAKAEN